MGLKSHSITIRYALVQAMFWMSFCVIFSFAGVYLLDRGFSNTQIGVVIGAAGMISAVLQPLAGGLADRNKVFSARPLIMILGCLMTGMAAGLLLIPGNVLWIVVFYGTLLIFLQVLTPLVYALGMDCINQGNSLNFGLARGVGSLTFAGASYLTGALVAEYGSGIIPFIILISYVLLLLAVLGFRCQQKNSGITGGKAGNESDKVLVKSSFFRRYRRFGFLLIGITLIFVSHNMLNNFIFQIMESKGGNSSSMGIAMAIAAACELPTMFLFFKMLQKAGSNVWLKVSGMFFSIKAFSTVLVSGVAGMYLIQVLQMFGFGLFVVSSVYYVNNLMDEKDRAKGQAYMTVTNTLGGVIGSLLGGILIDRMGMGTMLIVSTLAALAGTVIMGGAAESV